MLHQGKLLMEKAIEQWYCEAHICFWECLQNTFQSHKSLCCSGCFCLSQRPRTSEVYWDPSLEHCGKIFDQSGPECLNPSLLKGSEDTRAFLQSKTDYQGTWVLLSTPAFRHARTLDNSKIKSHTLVAMAKLKVKYLKSSYMCCHPSKI